MTIPLRRRLVPNTLRRFEAARQLNIEIAVAQVEHNDPLHLDWDELLAAGIARGILIALVDPDYALDMFQEGGPITYEEMQQRYDSIRQWIAEHPLPVNDRAG